MDRSRVLGPWFGVIPETGNFSRNSLLKEIANAIKFTRFFQAQFDFDVFLLKT